MIYHLQSKNTSILFGSITFYISTCFRKHYMQWLNFMIIIQVTNKVFIVFFTKRNLVR